MDQDMSRRNVRLRSVSIWLARVIAVTTNAHFRTIAYLALVAGDAFVPFAREQQFL